MLSRLIAFCGSSSLAAGLAFLLCWAQTTEGNDAYGWENASTHIAPAALVSKNLIQTYTITERMKRVFVDEHNRARETVMPRASNMMKISWDNELEKLATGYSKNCVFKHNKQAIHSRFGVGENIYISSNPRIKIESQPALAVRAWDMEKVDYTYSTRACKPGKMCGHYTQVVWATTFRVGCGISKCSSVNVRGKTWKNSVLLFCNYGPAGNYPRHPYQNGKPCSKCHPDDRCSKKLCTNPIRENIIPPVAKWSQWSPWSSCSATCGRGNRQRSRSCNTFVPNECPGSSMENEWYCSPYICGSTNARFKDWSPWSTCSRSCDGGVKKRERTCASESCRGGIYRISSSCNGQSCTRKTGPGGGENALRNKLQVTVLMTFLTTLFLSENVILATL